MEPPSKRPNAAKLATRAPGVGMFHILTQHSPPSRSRVHAHNTSPLGFVTPDLVTPQPSMMVARRSAVAQQEPLGGHLVEEVEEVSVVEAPPPSRVVSDATAFLSSSDESSDAGSDGDYQQTPRKRKGKASNSCKNSLGTLVSSPTVRKSNRTKKSRKPAAAIAIDLTTEEPVFDTSVAFSHLHSVRIYDRQVMRGERNPRVHPNPTHVSGTPRDPIVLFLKQSPMHGVLTSSLSLSFSQTHLMMWTVDSILVDFDCELGCLLVRHCSDLKTLQITVKTPVMDNLGLFGAILPDNFGDASQVHLVVHVPDVREYGRLFDKIESVFLPSKKSSKPKRGKKAKLTRFGGTPEMRMRMTKEREEALSAMAFDARMSLDEDCPRNVFGPSYWHTKASRVRLLFEQNTRWSFQGVPLEPRDLAGLLPGGFLNDSVVNAKISQLRKMAPCGIFVFSSYFYPHCRTPRSISLSTDVQHILIPVMEQNHWQLVIFCHDVETETWVSCLFDSFDGGGIGGPRIFSKLNKWFNSITPSLKTGADSKKIPSKSIKCPTQTNLCDCGVYMLKFLELYLQEPPDLVIGGRVNRDLGSWFSSDQILATRDDLLTQFLADVE